jgi:metal-responsive CopG/Arc/MetJ family transcriptional regulator
MWCKVVRMTTDASKSKREPKTTRASVSFPADLYATLEQMAEQKKVSVAWIVRDAAERYVDEQWPLFEKKNQGL